MNSQEIWQVEVNGQYYEASFQELTEWIAEGALLPQDNVRRGNLRWIKAIKVPALYGFFNAKELGVAPPPVATVTENQETVPAQMPATENIAAAQTFNATQAAPPQNYSENTQSYQTNQTNFHAPPPQNVHHEPDFAAPQNVCLVHNDTESVFVCDGCGSSYCKACPKSFGGTVKICPMCGAMCKPITAVLQQKQQNFQYQHDLSEGFGFSDFGKAIAYPFRYKTSLIAGAIMFMLFSLGQLATGMSSIFLVVAGIFSLMLANTLSFGIMANTIENMSQGKIDRDFMPDFADFNLWDDVVHPFFLYIGVNIVCFGLFFIVVAIGVWFTISSLQNSIITNQTGITQQAQSQADMAQQMPDYEGFAKQNTNLQNNSRNTEDDVMAAQEMIEKHRQGQLESTFGKTPETKQAQMRQFVTSLLSVGIPLLILAGITFLFGIFYLPAACAVAGYTRSFMAVINPAVGFDTIRRMGGDYFKMLFMSILLMVVLGIINGFLGLIFSPFNMPSVGNIPASAVGALFGFYLSIVNSVVIGYALYKNSAKLNLYR